MRRSILAGLSCLAGAFLISDALAIEHKIGAHLRFRYELWDNLITLGTNQTVNSYKDRSFFRLRAMLWDDIKFNNQTSLRIRLNTEPKYHMGPHYLVLKDGKKRKFDQDEIVIDNLYLDIKRPACLPLDLRIGRQDFLGPDTYGEGFLILDGTPGDGSRTFYFNALRVRWYPHSNHTIDFVAVRQTDRDIYLPSIYPSYDDGRGLLYINEKKRLTGSNEIAFWIYGRSKLNPNLSLEPYYIYKKEEKTTTTTVSSAIVSKNYLHNIGARLVYSINKDFKVRAELVHQFGEYSETGRDRRAWGGYIFFEKAFTNVAMKPLLEIGYVHLTGDDPGTNKDESFNPLFSRNPNWNELIIYTYLLETMQKGGAIPGYWTNLRMPFVRLRLNPTNKMNLTLSYQKLLADEKTKGLPSFMFSNSGKNRGDLFLAIVNYRFTKRIDGMLQYELFDPGSFYSKDAKTAHFFRAQIQWKY